MDHNGKCVTMQLAKLIKTSVAQIEKETGSERVLAEAVAEVATARGMPLYVLHGDRKSRSISHRLITVASLAHARRGLPWDL